MDNQGCLSAHPTGLTFMWGDESPAPLDIIDNDNNPHVTRNFSIHLENPHGEADGFCVLTVTPEP